MAPTKVGFVTYHDSPQLLQSDLPVVEYLEKNEIGVSAVCWEESNVVWSDFDLVVLRSPWNYHREIEKFRSWLLQLEDNEVPLCNSTKVVSWNSDKRYLLQLREKGYPVVPTKVLDSKSSKEDVECAMEEWPAFVIKPAVSAASFETHRFTSGHDKKEIERVIGRMLSHSHLLVQPFLSSILDGEISLVVIAGKFCHAIKKRPKAGEFRVQKSYGGTYEPYSAAPSLCRFAEEVVEDLSKEYGPLLYARIDGVLQDGKFLIMEVELIEPYLFLEYGASSHSAFAEGILNALQFRN